MACSKVSVVNHTSLESLVAEHLRQTKMCLGRTFQGPRHHLSAVEGEAHTSLLGKINASGCTYSSKGVFSSEI